MTDAGSADGQKKAGSGAGGARSAARLAAVQALYQIESNDEQAATVVREFIEHRLGGEIEGDLYIEADQEFFGDIVVGVGQRLEEIDGHISGAVSPGWSLKRLERILRALLRAGTYELIARPDVPTKVIIDEYVDVAHAFFSEKEPGFVNGVLDKLSQVIRGNGQTPDNKKARA